VKIVVFDDLPNGGAKRVVFEQVKGLSENHVVDYISNTVSTDFHFEQVAHNVFRFDLDAVMYKGWKRPLQELQYYFKLAPQYQQITHLINQINPDVVIVHPSRFSQAPGLLFFVSHPTLYFAEEWPRVVYEPSLHPLPISFWKKMYEWCRRQWIKQIDYEAARSATIISATSRYMQTALGTIYKRMITLLPLGVDVDRFTPSKVGHEKYFLFVGEKEVINGHPLIQEMEAVFGKEFPIKYVTFSGSSFRYSDKALSHLYQRAVATLCLSEHEPFGLVALESMSCGTPVIAVQEGGYMDTVSHRRTGIVIPRTVKALHDAMKLLTRDDALRNRLGQAGREKAVKHFGWNHHILLLEKILREVIRA